MLRKHRLDLFLAALTLVCVGLMFIASTDPLPASLRGSVVQPLLSQFSTGNQIIFDLAVGIVCSVIMYVLVVRVPEQKKRKRIKSSLRITFKTFKNECIHTYLDALGKPFDSKLPDQLMDRAAFKAYFSEQISDSQDRWHGVANGLNEDLIQKLVSEFEFFMHEIQYTLLAVDVSDEKVFEFFKAQAHILHSNRLRKHDYDDVKWMLRLLWSLHTGWNLGSGYPEQNERDAFEAMIAAI